MSNTGVEVARRAIYENPEGVRTEMTAEQAMRAHAQFGFKGRIIPLPLDGEAPLASAGERTKEQAAKEQAAQEVALKAMGLIPNDRWFGLGHEMIQAGKDKFKSLAKGYDDLPPVEEEYDRFVKQIKGERRTTTELDAASLKMDVGPDGFNRITRSGKLFLQLEPQFLDQFVEKFPTVFPRAKSLMAILDPDVRSFVFNRQVAKLADLSDAKRNAKLHYRILPGRDVPSAFAVTGTGYATVSSARIAETYIAELTGSGARGQIEYHAASTNVIGRFSWHAPQEFDAHVNDVFRGGGVWSTNDTGNGAHKLRGGVTRILCVNCTIVELEKLIGRRVHKGAEASFVESVRGGIKTVQGSMAPFIDAWGKLRGAGVEKLKVLNDSDDTVIDDPIKVLRALVDTGNLTPRIGRDALVEALLTSFNEEPGETVADLVNAVTRTAAHRGMDPFERESLEEAAGDMIPWMLGRIEDEKPRRLAIALDEKGNQTVVEV